MHVLFCLDLSGFLGPAFLYTAPFAGFVVCLRIGRYLWFLTRLSLGHHQQIFRSLHARCDLIILCSCLGNLCPDAQTHHKKSEKSDGGGSKKTIRHHQHPKVHSQMNRLSSPCSGIKKLKE
ncbi:hypothetical protein EDC04DRAFT_2773133 [Pisolithus marmoratus]|nr:hypothetical protein EDC04DRAFT_2773133 [Pisolithus marmoratus]